MVAGCVLEGCGCLLFLGRIVVIGCGRRGSSNSVQSIDEIKWKALAFHHRRQPDCVSAFKIQLTTKIN